MIFSFWLVSSVFLVFGTWLTLRRKRTGLPEGNDLPPVSVLKPLRGCDPGLEENLESFFRLSYPCYELIFSVADPADPAARLVKRLLMKYPRARARLAVGAREAGLNPKVNNLLEPYRAASYEILLISDSNIRVEPDYLARLVPQLKGDVGVLTSVVAGREAKGLGAELEATYLNTFYARAMNLCFATGNPFVIGKSMLFRKATAESLGGLEAFAGHIAEDYAFGEKVRAAGWRVALAVDSVPQFVGEYSVRSFWERHTRWSKIRRSHAPWIYLTEPLSMALPVAALAGWSWQPYFSFGTGFFYHLFLAFLCDAFLIQAQSGRYPFQAPLIWLLRECLALPLWLAALLNPTVNWRGHRLTIQRGGMIKLRENKCRDLHSSGGPLPAPTRLKAITSTAIGGSGRKRAILREG